VPHLALAVGSWNGGLVKKKKGILDRPDRRDHASHLIAELPLCRGPQTRKGALTSCKRLCLNHRSWSQEGRRENGEEVAKKKRASPELGDGDFYVGSPTGRISRSPFGFSPVKTWGGEGGGQEKLGVL